MRQKSIEQVEGLRWPDAPADASSLVIRCHEARRKPIDSLSPGDILILIGQGASLAIVVPEAIRLLEDNPLLDADYYDGDLLLTLLGIMPDYWRQYLLRRKGSSRCS
ncbi:MAG: hypothetical protein IPM46_03390 [Flavobacteriales bacterium]|nr:hypothetical protein [Flavobacteriales bacterium]